MNTIDFYLPGLHFVLAGQRRAVERLARPFESLLATSPVGSRRGGSLLLGCSISEDQPVMPPSRIAATGVDDVRVLDHGFRFWRSPAPGASGLHARRCLISNGYLSAEVFGRESRLEMTIRIRPTSSGRSPESVACLVDTLVDLVFPRLGFYPIAAGAARAPADERGRHAQMLVFGPADAREHVLGELAGFGWSTTAARPTLFLRRGENAIRLVSPCATLPEVAPRVGLVFDDPRQRYAGLRLGRDADRPHIRNLSHHVTRALRGHDLGMDGIARREREEVICALLGQTRVVKISDSRSIEEGARRSLIALGIDRARGWDLPAPASVTRPGSRTPGHRERRRA